MPSLPFEKTAQWKILRLLFFAAYLGLLLFTISRHEVWRDEGRALGIAMESHSPADLFRDLHNEGHPFLWPFLLYLSYHAIHRTIVLKAMSVGIAALASWIFLWKAPFAWWQRVLFLFGYFPLYEYGVISRNYGIGMLFLFLFCLCYPGRFRKPVLAGVCLFLLANTNIHSTILTIAILSAVSAEFFFRKKTTADFRSAQAPALLLGFALAAAGIAWAVCQTVPDATTRSTSLYVSGLGRYFDAVRTALFSPSEMFPEAFSFNSQIVPAAVLAAGCIFLLETPFLLSIFLMTASGLALFFILIYVGYARHQGVLYLTVLAVFWMNALVPEKEKIALPIFFRKPILKKTFLSILLLNQCWMTVSTVAEEAGTQFSSTHDLARFIRFHPELHDAILLSEPDFRIEGMNYYVSNPLYFPRENRFGRKVNYDGRNRDSMTLREILGDAERLKKTYHRPVLFLIGCDLKKSGPFEAHFLKTKTFTYTPEDLERLLRLKKLRRPFYRALGDENFCAYWL